MTEKLAFINDEHHKKLVQLILSDCLARDEIIGLMIIGSVARGDAFPDSDIDFYFLLEHGFNRKFHSEVKENILMEYKYADCNQIKRNLENKPMEIYSFLDGKVLLDKKGYLQDLILLAKQKYKGYTVSENKMTGISHWLNSSLIKIKAAQKEKDDLKASFVIITSFWTMLEGIWAINNKPTPPSGSVLVHIKALPHRLTNLDELLYKVSLGNTNERINATIIVIEWVLSNLELKLQS